MRIGKTHTIFFHVHLACSGKNVPYDTSLKNAEIAPGIPSLKYSVLNPGKIITTNPVANHVHHKYQQKLVAYKMAPCFNHRT